MSDRTPRILRMASQKHYINRAISNLYSVLLAATFLVLILQLHVTQTLSQKDFSYADYLLGNGSLENRIDENFTGVSNGTDANSHWFIGSGSQYGLPEAIVIAITLICIIVGTVIGNILVCVAVCLVKKLRRPYNYLIVSLAVSDLCVAVLVMPMAMLYEVLGKWPFGPVICDLWVSFDVLSCTASILNLCMISVDRYYAITKPLEYGVKRTPKRMILCVFLVWFGAACISLPPLLILGNEREEYHCIVCQNFGYQIYATVGSFYLPLTVMIVVYYKIFRAARKIVMEEKRAQSHLEAPYYLEINVKNGRTAEAKLLAGVNNATTNNLDDTPLRTNQNFNKKGTVRRTTSSMTRCFSSNQRKSNESQCPMLNQPSTPVRPGEERHRTRSECSKHSDNNDNISTKRKVEENVSTANRIRNSFSSFAHKNHLSLPKDATGGSSSHQKKLRFQLAKERKASTTLGIIMSAFIICWLPFFVLALVRPFLHDQNDIPATFSSLFLWLGYANSLLNPIIYATLNKDFRKPFQEILFFRCSNLNNIMREDFYHSQYGDPETHHCALSNSSKAQNFEVETEIVTAVADRDNTVGATATYL